jgi:AcrR family transcriptional regulator
MARTVDYVARARRRQCFLEAAGRVIERKGYEQMTVQDVLDDVGQSKGAFYHYFDSKRALVEALVDDQGKVMFAHLERRLEAPRLSAVDKFVCLFRESSRLKLERKGLWRALLPMWLSEGNAAVRERAALHAQERLAPLLGQIITEGVVAGVFATAYPQQVGRMVVAILEDFRHIVLEVLTTPVVGARDRVRVEQAVAAFHETLERVLGAGPGTLHLLETADVMAWIGESEVGPTASPSPPAMTPLSGFAGQG